MKREGIHGLIQYLNKTTNNATNTQVAKAIFTNRDKINEISLEKLAGDNYLSQASVSRFIKIRVIKISMSIVGISLLDNKCCDLMLLIIKK